jgi:phage/conjugal plasmid C-4 type zinc finger TraR family protein
MGAAMPGPAADPVVRLRALRDELEAQLIGMGELDEDGARPRFSNHLAEDAQDQQQRASDAAMRKALVADIHSLDHAIQRGQQGLYGICEDCGHEIPPRRLQVIPGTTLCVTCQSRREPNRTPM